MICISAKATMQTFPCAHRVVCRKCFVKTIQVAVSQRMLPLRCVVCRARILRLNIPATTPDPKSWKTSVTTGSTGKDSRRPCVTRLSHVVGQGAALAGGRASRVTPAPCSPMTALCKAARPAGGALPLSRSLRSIDERDEEEILSSSSQLLVSRFPCSDHRPGHEQDLRIAHPLSPPSASFVRRDGNTALVIHEHADQATEPRSSMSSTASSAASLEFGSTSESIVLDSAAAASAKASKSAPGCVGSSNLAQKCPIMRFPLPSFLKRLLIKGNSVSRT